MKGNAKDYVSTAQQFFTAYDAHDVDGMLGLCYRRRFRWRFYAGFRAFMTAPA